MAHALALAEESAKGVGAGASAEHVMAGKSENEIALARRTQMTRMPTLSPHATPIPIP
jgi:hypothetical protein